MPVILHLQEYDIWLNREISGTENLKPLYKPYPTDVMEMYPVSPQVNSTRNASAELIKPVQDKE